MFDDDVDDAEDWSREVIEAVRRGESSIADIDAADRLVDGLAALMVAVSTGGPSIQEVDADYKREARALAAVLRRLDIKNPNRFTDLWQWYGRWSDGTLPSYASRRTFIADLYRPVREAIEMRAESSGEIAAGADEGLSGWPEVDKRMAALRRRVREAEDADDCRAVGLQCVSVLEALGRAVFDPDAHLPDGEEIPHANAAKPRIRFFLHTAAAGKRFENVRRLANAAWDQAQAVKHRDEPNTTDAGIAADSVALLVAMLRRVADEVAPASD